jgi:hypothetical protein
MVAFVYHHPAAAVAAAAAGAGATPRSFIASRPRRRCPPRAARRSLPVRACAAAAGGDPPIPPALEADIRAYLSGDSDAAAAECPLAYLTLRDFGRMDLIDRIMAAGGHLSVSRRLGIRVDDSCESYRAPRRPEELPSFFAGLAEEAQSGPGLALGAGLDARLGADVSGLRPAAAASAGEAGATARSGPLSARPAPVPSAEEVAAIGRDIVVVVDEPVPAGERLALDAGMRAGTLLLVLAASVGYGRASAGVVDGRVADALRAGSAALALGHVGLAAYAAAVLAPRLGRSAPVWALKVLLSGAPGLASLRRFGPLAAAEDGE